MACSQPRRQRPSIFAGAEARRESLSLVLTDPTSRHFREPLSAVTRLLAPDLWQPQSRVQYSGAITSARGWKLRPLAWIYWFYGFPQMKVKVGIAGHDDVKRLRTIRRRMGDKVDLRIDANEAWARTYEREYARTLRLLPGKRIRPDAQHTVVGLIAVAMVVCGVGASVQVL